MISEAKRNGSGYYDPTAYMAMMNVRKEGENKMEVYRGEAIKQKYWNLIMYLTIGGNQIQ